jgi:hypothetical protein
MYSEFILFDAINHNDLQAIKYCVEIKHESLFSYMTESNVAYQYIYRVIKHYAYKLYDPKCCIYLMRVIQESLMQWHDRWDEYQTHPWVIDNLIASLLSMFAKNQPDDASNLAVLVSFLNLCPSLRPHYTHNGCPLLSLATVYLTRNHEQCCRTWIHALLQLPEMQALDLCDILMHEYTSRLNLKLMINFKTFMSWFPTDTFTCQQWSTLLHKHLACFWTSSKDIHPSNMYIKSYLLKHLLQLPDQVLLLYPFMHSIAYHMRSTIMMHTRYLLKCTNLHHDIILNEFPELLS